MNILMLSIDRTLFKSGMLVTNDTQKRHALYDRLLRQTVGPSSSIRMIGYSDHKDGLSEMEVDAGLRIYPTNSRHRAFFMAGILMLLPRVLNGWRPDLVSVQTPWEDGLIGYLVSRMTGAFFMPQLHMDLFSEQWKKERPENGLRKYIATALIRRADGVRVVNQKFKDEVSRNLQFPKERIFATPVGIHFTPADNTIAKDVYKGRIHQDLPGKPVILFVGVFYDPKNLPLWVEVADLVAKQDTEVRFVLAGDGPLFAKIQGMIQAKGLSSRCHLLGMIGHEQLPEIYGAADLFLFCSNHETFGRVLVESLLSHLPVVTTDCSGPGQLIRESGGGVTAPIGDKQALVQAVLTLLANPEKRQKLAEQGYAHVKQLFSMEKQAQDLIDGTVSIYALGHRKNT